MYKHTAEDHMDIVSYQFSDDNEEEDLIHLAPAAEGNVVLPFSSSGICCEINPFLCPTLFIVFHRVFM